MPRVEEIDLLPWGWENDPEEERFKLLTIDYLTTTTWNNMAVFFKLSEEEKPKVAATLKEGLARALSQVRHFAGTIEKDANGQHSIVKRRTSTVRFVIQHLDGPEDQFPSFDEIEKQHFTAPILGDIGVLSNAPMTCGNKPEAHPDNSPATASYKANFIPGGLIFNMHTHHYSNGLGGWSAFCRLIAGHCSAILGKGEHPTFDPICLDRRPFFERLGLDKPVTLDQPQVDAPARADRNTKHRPCQTLLFHLPKSRAAELKKAASPTDGSWISTYNAMCAQMWRVTSKIREPLYKPDRTSTPLWAESVSMHKLFTDPPLPGQMQGNLQFDVTSQTCGRRPFTVAEIISDAPLSDLASYIRQMTESVTVDMLASTLQKYSQVRNKQDLSIRVESFPPMSLLVSDWRSAELCTYDFGFAKPYVYRHLFGGVPLCQAVVFPPRTGPRGDDEGMEILFTFEIELTQQLLDDPEWNKYFEFRGVDERDEEVSKAKL